MECVDVVGVNRDKLDKLLPVAIADAKPNNL